MSDDRGVNPIANEPSTPQDEIVREVDWSFNGDDKPMCYGGRKLTPFDISPPEIREYLLRQNSRHFKVRALEREEVDAARAISDRLLYAADAIVEFCPSDNPSTQAALAKLHEALAMAHLALAQRR